MKRHIGLTYCLVGCMALIFGDDVIAGFFLLIGNMWFVFGKGDKQ